ncbi:MAG: hypothetical protein ACTSU5_11055 [Promethearchaeota archaeon]
MISARDLFQGTLSRRSATVAFGPLHLGVILVALALAYLSYPPEYEYGWTTSMISRLGWPDQNPVGLIFFSAGTAAYGFILLFAARRARLGLAWVSARGATLVQVLTIVVAVGWIGIGLVPNYSLPATMFVHAVNAFAIFGGSLLAGATSLTVLARGMLGRERAAGEPGGRRSGRREVLVGAAVAHAAAFFFMVVVLAILVDVTPPGLRGHYTGDPGIPVFSSPPFYEWLSFFGSLGMFASLQVALPPTDSRQRPASQALIHQGGKQG